MKYSELLVLWSLAKAVENANVVAIEATNDLTSKGGFAAGGLVHMPLVPHHVQRNRRLAESGGGEVDLRSRERPTRYQRASLSNNRGEGRHLQANQIVEMFQGYGTHYVDLWCGTPPQRQTVIVDTGSGATAFPCSQCKSCGVPKYHIDSLFVESDSSTFQKLSCDECLEGRCQSNECKFSKRYQEGSSWYAYEAEDQCYVGGLHDKAISQSGAASHKDDLDPYHAPSLSFGMKFGCQTKLTGLFISQLADGIMGMDNGKAAFWKQAHTAGVVSKQAFSLCYSRQDNIDRKGTESGSMTLGGSDDRVHSTPMVYTSTNVGSRGFYAVEIRQMYLRAGGGGPSANPTDPSLKIESLKLGSNGVNIDGQVIVDSGTTDTYFTSKIASRFKSAFEKLAGTKYGHSALQMTIEEVEALPTILIQLAGDESLNQKVADDNGGSVVGLAKDLDPSHPHDVILAIPPTHYMEYEADKDKWTNRFYVDEPRGGVIGGNAIMGHDVFFDVDNKRLGWAEADCDYSALVASYNFAADDGTGKPTLSPVAAAEMVNTTVQSSVVEKDPFDAEEPIQTFCSTLTCQGGFIFGAVVIIGIATAVLLRRTTNDDTAYAVAQAELELPGSTAPSAEDEIRYRDEPEFS